MQQTILQQYSGDLKYSGDLIAKTCLDLMSEMFVINKQVKTRTLESVKVSAVAIGHFSLGEYCTVSSGQSDPEPILR